MPTPFSHESKSKAQKSHQLEYRRLTHDMQQEILRRHSRETIPTDWDHLDSFHPVDPHKTKVTLRLDADMLKWFRKLGPGYQKRINQVLRIYWQAVLSGDVARYAGEEYLAVMIDMIERMGVPEGLDFDATNPSTLPDMQGETDEQRQTFNEGNGGEI